MSTFTKYNKKGSISSAFKFQITKEMNIPYMSLKELELANVKEFVVLGFYINEKSKYGASPVAYNNQFQVNLPKSWVDSVKELVKDEEAVNLINDGACKAVIKTYESQRYGKCFDIELV